MLPPTLAHPTTPPTHHHVHPLITTSTHSLTHNNSHCCSHHPPTHQTSMPQDVGGAAMRSSLSKRTRLEPLVVDFDATTWPSLLAACARLADGAGGARPVILMHPHDTDCVVCGKGVMGSAWGDTLLRCGNCPCPRVCHRACSTMEAPSAVTTSNPQTPPDGTDGDVSVGAPKAPTHGSHTVDLRSTWRCSRCEAHPDEALWDAPTHVNTSTTAAASTATSAASVASATTAATTGSANVGATVSIAPSAAAAAAARTETWSSDGSANGVGQSASAELKRDADEANTPAEGRQAKRQRPGATTPSLTSVAVQDESGAAAAAAGDGDGDASASESNKPARRSSRRERPSAAATVVLKQVADTSTVSRRSRQTRH
jgi:hypothetical protein